MTGQTLLGEVGCGAPFDFPFEATKLRDSQFAEIPGFKGIHLSLANCCSSFLVGLMIVLLLVSL